MYTASPFGPASPVGTCSSSGLARDPADDLRRQIVLIDDLMNRASTVVTLLPDGGALHGWWGPARDAFQQSLGIERARLSRQVERLDAVRAQLERAVMNSAGVLP